MEESLNTENCRKEYRILRSTSLEEINIILYSFNTVFNPPLSQRISDFNEYAKKLFHNAVVYTVKEDDDFIGFAAFYANDKKTHVAYLTQIAIKSEAQNRKIGKSLLDKCIETSKKYGMSKLKLEVGKFNTIAINFYKKCGFKFIGEASAHSIYMIKSLLEKSE